MKVVEVVKLVETVQVVELVEVTVVEVVEEGCRVSVWAHLCPTALHCLLFPANSHLTAPDTPSVCQSWDNKVGGRQGGAGCAQAEKMGQKHPFLAACLHNPHLQHITTAKLFTKKIEMLNVHICSFENSLPSAQLECWASHSELIRSPQHTLLLSRSSCFYISLS